MGLLCLLLKSTNVDFQPEIMYLFGQLFFLSMAVISTLYTEDPFGNHFIGSMFLTIFIVYKNTILTQGRKRGGVEAGLH